MDVGPEGRCAGQQRIRRGLAERAQDPGMEPSHKADWVEESQPRGRAGATLCAGPSGLLDPVEGGAPM